MNFRSLMGTSLAVVAGLGLASAGLAQSSGSMGAMGGDATMQPGNSAGSDRPAQTHGSMSGTSATTSAPAGKTMKKHAKRSKKMTGADMPPATNSSAADNTPSEQQH